MANIVFMTREGEVAVNAVNGISLLEAANRAGVRLFGGCSGAGVCGTCHVVIDSMCMRRIGEASPSELDIIEIMPNRQVGSRLACQVTVTDDLDGAIVTVPFD
jgi:2Fe-2S ferredoxin